MNEPDGSPRRGATAPVRTVAVAAAASGELAGQAPQPARAKTFVLIHGAWHGGWCWRRVSDRLERLGHRVFSPSLTGLADRSHLLSKDIDLDTHIADIVGLFKWERLTHACLVMHSYGGWPGSGALEEVGDRVSCVVMLDAFKPEHGQRGADFASEFSRKALAEALAKGEPGRPGPKAAAFSVNPKDYDWINSRLTPQPNGVALQPIKLTGARERIAKKTYIRAPLYKQPAFDKAYAECKADPAWTTFEIATAGHDVMVDAPDWLVDRLVEVS